MAATYPYAETYGEVGDPKTEVYNPENQDPLTMKLRRYCEMDPSGVRPADWTQEKEERTEAILDSVYEAIRKRNNLDWARRNTLFGSKVSYADSRPPRWI